MHSPRKKETPTGFQSQPFPPPRRAVRRDGRFGEPTGATLLGAGAWVGIQSTSLWVLLSALLLSAPGTWLRLSC